MPPRDVREILDTERAVCSIEAVTVATHDRGLAVNERYGFSLYLQDGQVIDGGLRVANPFLTR
jgi:predicted nucleic acid-binding protein